MLIASALYRRFGEFCYFPETSQVDLDVTLSSVSGRFQPVQFLYDRIDVNSALLVGAFVAVLLLSSQSASSMLSYLLCLAMLVRFQDWRDIVHCPMVWPVLAILLYLPLTSFWSDAFSWRGLFSQLVRALLTFSFVVAFAECQLRGVLQKWLFVALAGAGSGVALLCIVLFYIDPPHDGRLNGLGQLDTQVVAGLVFSFATLAVLHTAFSGRSQSLWLTIVLLTPLVTAVWLTGSRNALMSLVLGTVVLVAAHSQPTVKRFLWTVLPIFVAVVVGVGLAWSYPELRELVFPRGDSFRLLIWEQTWLRLQDSPWIGMGILSSDDIQMGDIRFHHPHNLYLSVAFQGGLVGLALFGWLLLRVLREFRLAYQHNDVKFALAVLGLALPAYALDGHELLDKIGDTWFLIWLPVAIALGMRWHSVYR